MTDEEQKQIETMAIVMCENFELRMKNQTCAKCRTYNKNCYTIHKAELLHSAGYQKADEVRKETAKKIFDALYQWLNLENTEKCGFVTIQKFDFLSKFRELYQQFYIEIKE